jgi:hypothetical protein
MTVPRAVGTHADSSPASGRGRRDSRSSRTLEADLLVRDVEVDPHRVREAVRAGARDYRTSTSASGWTGGTFGGGVPPGLAGAPSALGANGAQRDQARPGARSPELREGAAEEIEPPCRHPPGGREGSYTISIIFEMMATTDPVTSIPVHQSTLRALRGTKMADQTWDDFLLALADDFISPSMRADLDRRLRTEPIIPGAEMKKEFADWRRRSARP